MSEARDLVTAPPAPVDIDMDIKIAAEAAVKSGLYGKLTVWEAAAKISTAREIGISPMAAMGSLWIVNGKLVMSYSLLATLVQRSTRFRYRILQNDDKAARIEFLEKVDGVWESLGTSSFTIEMAKRAQLLGKGPWQAYPEAMLFARALSQGVRMMTPSLTMMPAYVQGEIDNDLDQPRVAPPAPARDLSFGTPHADGDAKKEKLRDVVISVQKENA